MAEPLSLELLKRWRDRGDEDAAAELFYRYAGRLLALARSQMSPALAQRLDAEDVVQSACRSFFVRVRDGRLMVQPGGEMWELLAAITMRKIYGQLEHQTAQKRDIRREQAQDESICWFEVEALARDPGPEDQAVLADERDRALRSLSPVHRRIVELRFEEYTTTEIAAQVKRSDRLVRLVLKEFGKGLKKRLAELDEL